MLSTFQKMRYERNILVATLGEQGQEKLLQSKVLLIGAGGLGSPVALYLTAAGIGTLGIVDDDVVDSSNLQRQILHGEDCLGISKVESARQRLMTLNSQVHLHTYQERVTKEVLRQLLVADEYDIVVDGTDNFATKFLINDVCVEEEKPFVHAGVLAMQGQLMTYVPHKSPCYRCVFEDEPAPGTVPTSKDVGIIGAIAGTLGTLQAMEVIKYVTEMGELLLGRMLIYDGLSMTFRQMNFHKNEHCQACHKG